LNSNYSVKQECFTSKLNTIVLRQTIVSEKNVSRKTFKIEKIEKRSVYAGIWVLPKTDVCQMFYTFCQVSVFMRLSGNRQL